MKKIASCLVPGKNFYEDTLPPAARGDDRILNKEYRTRNVEGGISFDIRYCLFIIRYSLFIP